ncbi:MAG TPA: FecR family protein [Polyangia bacterium]|nr:FecR family protein [Polyangia bacterium]
MTLMEQIRRAGQEVEAGWDDRDVDRVWHGLRRKRRRRAVAAGATALATAGVAVWALLVLPGRNAVVHQAGRPAAPPPALHQDQETRFADGSTAVPLGGQESSLTVVEDAPARVVVALARGGARFEVAHRPDRVFVVRAGDVSVSVLGTAFTVERVADRVGVTVSKGAVRVDWGVGARQLAAGEDGWFPPLLVSPSADGGHAETTGKEAPPVLAPRRSARDVSPPSATPKIEEPAEPAAAPTTEELERAVGINGASDAATLMADADRARLAGRFEEGAALLSRLVREHPTDPRAPLAAFSLGRLLLGELGHPEGAARAFARARALAPDGPLALEALAREAEAWTRAGEPDRARACEAEYRARIKAQGGQRP